MLALVHFNAWSRVAGHPVELSGLERSSPTMNAFTGLDPTSVLLEAVRRLSCTQRICGDTKRRMETTRCSAASAGRLSHVGMVWPDT